MVEQAVEIGQCLRRDGDPARGAAAQPDTEFDIVATGDGDVLEGIGEMKREAPEKDGESERRVECQRNWEAEAGNG